MEGLKDIEKHLRLPMKSVVEDLFLTFGLDDPKDQEFNLYANNDCEVISFSSGLWFENHGLGTFLKLKPQRERTLELHRWTQTAEQVLDFPSRNQYIFFRQEANKAGNIITYLENSRVEVENKTPSGENILNFNAMDQRTTQIIGIIKNRISNLRNP
jgi:hypothetical protein